jgi:hypothetical protein
MKSFTTTAIVVATLALSASASFAQITPNMTRYSLLPLGSTGTLSRDAVRAEYFAAQKNGTAVPKGDLGNDTSASQSGNTLSRTAVQAEYFAAKKLGTLPRLGEMS